MKLNYSKPNELTKLADYEKVLVVNKRNCSKKNNSVNEITENDPCKCLS